VIRDRHVGLLDPADDLLVEFFLEGLGRFQRGFQILVFGLEVFDDKVLLSVAFPGRRSVGPISL